MGSSNGFRAMSDNETFTIQIYELQNGSPTVIRKIEGFTSKEEGMTRLRNIGHTWDYSMLNWGHLLNAAGEKVAQLNIWKHTYGVVDLEKDE